MAIAEPGGTARRWASGIGVLATMLFLGLAATAGAEAPPRIAVFDFELVDSSLQGEIEGADPADLARLKLLSDDLRSRLEASGRFEVIDTAPAAEAIAAAGHLRRCNGCEVRLGRQLGADLAAVGWVQKVSNLILNINLEIREVATRELVFAGSVDIRGNTDESWRHGLRHLVVRRLLEE